MCVYGMVCIYMCVCMVCRVYGYEYVMCGVCDSVYVCKMVIMCWDYSKFNRTSFSNIYICNH